MSTKQTNLPYLERFLSYASGDAPWTESELEIRSVSQWWLIREAEAFAIRSLEDWVAGRRVSSLHLLRLSADSLLEMTNKDAQATAVKYVGLLLPSDLQDELQALVSAANQKVSIDYSGISRVPVPQTSAQPLRPSRRSPKRRVRDAIMLVALLSVVLTVIWRGTMTPPQLASKIIGSFEVTGVASKGSEEGNSGDPFRILFDVQTSASKGWLIQIDNEAAVMHQSESVSNGRIVLEHEDKFDTRDCYEYGVLLLADKDISALDSKNVNWLSADDLRQLQEVAPSDPDFNKATAVIQRALQAAGISGVREVAVVRKRHHLKQRPF